MRRPFQTHRPTCQPAPSSSATPLALCSSCYSCVRQLRAHTRLGIPLVSRDSKHTPQKKTRYSKPLTLATRPYPLRTQRAGLCSSARHTRGGVCRCYGPLTSLAHLSHGRVSQRGPLAKSYRREVYFLYLAFWASESLPQAAPSALPTSPNAIFGFFLTMPGRSCLQKSM